VDELRRRGTTAMAITLSPRNRTGRFTGAREITLRLRRAS
jgi:hypothetical protein